MTMMISKFHRLIQSRLLWGVFLVIIVFSFVIWGMVWPSDLKKAEQMNAAGLLDGQTVSFGEFRTAHLSTFLARALALGREVENTPESEALLRRLAWQRLATLREAAQLGIGATEEELISAIRGNFANTNGVFDRQQYDAFLQNQIRPLGFTSALFEQHVREEIIIQKLSHLIGQQAQVTPLEIRRTFDTLLDEFTVEYAEVTSADVEKGVSATEKDARQLFDADPAAFTIPEQREVSYAAFPIADYLVETNGVSDEEVQDYYELHIDDYTTTEDGEDGKPRETIADLADVRDGIVKALRREAAVDKADEAATDLTSRAIPDRDGAVPHFAAEAEKAGRSVQTLAPFSRLDVPLEDAGAAFTAVAFDLVPNAFERVSAPVSGQDDVYVIYLERQIAARVPTFDEVKEKALAVVQRKAVQRALDAKAVAIQEAARAGLAAGKSFADAVAAAGAKVETVEPFTGLSGSSSSNETIQVLVQAVVSYNQGEVTDPLPTGAGRIVAYLKTRTPADSATFDSYQPEIAAAIRSRRGQGLFRDWQAGLLAPERFTDLQRPATTPDGSEEDGDEEGGGEPATNEVDAAADETM